MFLLSLNDSLHVIPLLMIMQYLHIEWIIRELMDCS